MKIAVVHDTKDQAARFIARHPTLSSPGVSWHGAHRPDGLRGLADDVLILWLGKKSPDDPSLEGVLDAHIVRHQLLRVVW